MKKKLSEEGFDQSSDRIKDVRKLMVLPSSEKGVLFFRNPILKYAFALVMVIAAILLRFELAPLLGPGYQSITVYPVVIIVAILAGRGPALLNAALSSLAAAYAFSGVINAAVLTSTTLILLTALLTGWLAERLKDALNRTQESERRFRVAQELLPDGFVILRPVRNDRHEIVDFIFVYENAATGRLGGTDPDTIAGRRLTDIFPNHAQTPFHKFYIDVAQSGTPGVLELPFYIETIHQEKWFRVAAVPTGQEIAILAQDTTERKRTEQELALAKERFELFMKYLPGAAFMKDSAGKYIFANPGLALIFGKPSEQILGKTDADLLPSETALYFQENDRRAWSEGSVETIELLRHPNGEQHHSMVTKFIVPGPGSEPACIGGVTFDITEQIKAQEALRKSEQRLRQRAAIDEAIMANMGEGLYALDVDGRVTYVNPAAEHILGFSGRELIGRKMHDTIHYSYPDGRPFPARECASTQVLYHGKAIVNQEDIFIRKNGQFFPVVYSSAPILLDGKHNGLVVVFRDITASKKAQEDLRESEQRFRTLADNITQLAWMADEKGSFFWLNKRACEYTGGTFESLQGTAWQKLVHPSQLKHLLKKNDEVIRNRAFFEDTALVRGKDGSYRWFLCRALPIFDEKDNIVRWFGTATDIHDLKQTQQALEESEQKFRMLAENAGAIIGIMQDQKIIYANPFAEAASGYTREELYKIDVPKLIHPDYQKAMMERARRRQAGEPIESHYEFIMVRKDGQHRWLDFSPIMIHYRGKPAIIGMAFDVTQRKRAEAALRESEETFRLLAEHARAIIGIVQGERFVYVNPYLEELSGYTHEEILQMPIGQMVHPDSRAAVLDRARRRQAGEQVETHYEFAMQTKSGSKVWLDFSVTAIHYHGKPAIVGIAIDVTDRKHTEEALRESEGRFRELADSMPQIVWTADPDGRMLYFNRQWYELTNTSTPAGAEDWLPAIHPDDVQRFEQLRAEAIAGGKPFYAEFRLIVAATGEARWHVARAVPIRDEQGNIVRWYGTATDIHDLKQARDALDSLKLDLENKNEELESIIGIVSHDLRAPLVNIQGFSNELKMDSKTVDTLLSEAPVEQKVEKQLDTLLHRSIPESIHYIQTSAEAMNSLVIALVEVARAGVLPLKPERIDMNALIKKITASIETQLKQGGGSYDIENMPDCLADRTQVEQILRNLIDNAVKYLDPTRFGQICIGGKLQADSALYWVADNGIGISPEHQEKIFEPYYQLREKASGGLGMGLVTVKRMVERNGGKIWVVSEKGKYSTFYVSLPSP